MTPRVTLIGDVMLDVVTRAIAPLEATSDTAAATVVGRGGSAANAAIRLARSGCAVTYVAAVGSDPAADVLAALFARSGVRTRWQVVEEPTGVVVAIVDGSGQRMMLTSRGANRRLALDHVADALAEPFDHLHVSGYTVLDDDTRDVACAALRLARSRGVSVSVDACSVGPLRRIGADRFLEAVAPATTLFANEEEAALLGGGALEVALTRLAERFDEVVVTLGPRGALVRRGTVETRAAATARVVLDTTGAGDAVTGAYLGARLGGASPRDALDAAMAAAGEVVAGLGAEG